MEFFKRYFPDTDFDNVNASGEVKVLCPFPHHHTDSDEYTLESRPSANINVEKEVYFCHACGVGMSELQFVAKVENLNLKNARNLLNAFENVQQDVTEDDHNRLLTEENKHLYEDLGISRKVVDELKLGEREGGLSFPVYLYNTLLDIRVYKKGGKPKCKSCAGAKEGFIIPFDIWKKEKKHR